MPYKISGSKSETARIIIIKESDWSIESNTVVSGSGVYEIDSLVSGTKTVAARSIDGYTLGYGSVDAEYYAPLYPAEGDRGVIGGGQTSGIGFLSTIYYKEISTLGNASGFGNFTTPKRQMGACSNSGYNRGIFFAGYVNTFGSINVIDYITISTPGTSNDFGDCTIVVSDLAGASNGPLDRGVHSGGSGNVIGYITISTTGDAQDFGDLTLGRYGHGACSNNINDRAVFGGGGSTNSVLDYITVSTTGDATSFGNLTLARHHLAACSNGINERGVFGGGYTSSPTNVLDYITISSTSNATNFGDLKTGRHALAATSNGTADRGLFMVGYNGSVNTNSVDYITISSIGNASDFGDVGSSIGLYYAPATSNA